MNNTTFGDDTFGYYETVAGGAGAVSTQSNVDMTYMCLCIGARLEWAEWCTHSHD